MGSPLAVHWSGKKHPMPYHFGPFRLDLDNASLWQGDTQLTLRPKTFDLLAHLVRHAGELVTKDELLEAVWPDTVVSDSVLTASMSELRKVLGETAREPQYIATVHRRGYRFVAPVTTASSEPSDAAEVSSRPRAEMERRPHGKMVAREAELTQLHDRFRQALQGHRQVVFITGEAGIGKTTLVDAFVDQLSSSASIWIGRGQCIEHYGAGEPYLPLLEALGRLGKGPDGARITTVLHQHAPSWLLQLPSLVSDAEIEVLHRRASGTTRERMLRELAEAMEALTDEQTLVLVLEDLHWSDPATLDWLTYMVRRRDASRLLVIGTYRPVEAIVKSHPVRLVTDDLQRHGQGLEIALEYFSLAGVSAYLKQRFGETSELADLAEVLHQRTTGSPLFIVTLVDQMVQHGVVEQVSDGWVVRGNLREVAGGVPDSLRRMLEQQLERLSAEDHQLLEVASVAGAEFSAAVLGADGAIERVDAQCAALARRGQFVRAQGMVSWPDGTVSGGYRFIHALHQETLYDRIPVSRRVGLHKRIGMQLEAGYRNQAPERAAELAMHFEQGRDIQRAVFYLQHAGDQAVSRSAQREAVQWYERALQRLEQLPQTAETTGQAIDLHLALRAALIPLAENAESFAHLRTAAHLAKSLGDDRRQGYIDAYLTREWFSISDYDQALAAGHRALTHAQDDLQRISTQLYLSYAYRGIGAYQRIVELLGPVLATLTSAPDSEHMGLATLPAVSLRFSLTHALAELGRFAEGAAQAKEAIRIAEAHEHVFGLYQAYRGLGSLRLHQGHIEPALPLLERCLVMCQQSGMSGSLSVTSARLGIAYVYAGRLTDGLRLLEQGVADKVTSHPDYVLRLILLGEGYGYAGRRDEALALAHEALEMASARRERGTEAYAQHLLGQLYACNLDTEVTSAATWYQQALALACELGMRPLQAHCYYGLGHLYHQHRLVEPAREALAAAVALYQCMDMTFWLRQAELAQLETQGS